MSEVFVEYCLKRKKKRMRIKIKEVRLKVTIKSNQTDLQILNVTLKNLFPKVLSTKKHIFFYLVVSRIRIFKK